MDETGIFINNEIVNGRLETIRPCRNYRFCGSVYFVDHPFGWIDYRGLTQLHLEMLEKHDKLCDHCEIIEEQWFGGI